MSVSILRKISQQIILMLVVFLVLLAAYVSAGRQFMPAISGYADFLEEQILENAGLPVSIQSLTGSFSGFNPVIQINGLSMLVGSTGQQQGQSSNALDFDHAILEVDMPRSIWQRRWVLDQFVIEGLTVEAEQTSDGGLRLLGMGGEQTDVDLAALYRTLQRVSRLDFRNVELNLRNRNEQFVRLMNGSAVIQNQGRNHFFHANANFANSLEQISFSFEAVGNELSSFDGDIHVALPSADYSGFLLGSAEADLSIAEFVGGGEIWMRFLSGQLQRLIVEPALDSLALAGGEDDIPFAINEFSGVISLTQELATQEWELSLSDVAIGWEDLSLDTINITAQFQLEEYFRIYADSINLDVLASFAGRSSIVSPAVRERVRAFAPAGSLDNLYFETLLDASTVEQLQLRSNLNRVALASVNASPAMTGLDGYVEVSYGRDEQAITGFAEVESRDFTINIPNVFLDTWHHDYVNGRLNFQVNLAGGQQIRLLSSVIVAESGIVDGRVQFSSLQDQPDDGERRADLELMVGALRVDASQKSPYLPNAPRQNASLRGAMAWLDGALIDGDVSNTGVIYRGSTLRGSAGASRTFQSFYRVENGVFRFADDWPQLEELTALVVTDDNNIDIYADSGSSNGLQLGRAQGTIRRDANNFSVLNVNGHIDGFTAQGLDYLQQAPVGDGLHKALENWQAEGRVNADIDVRVPLNSSSGEETQVHLLAMLADNNLYLPDYALDFTALQGEIIYDTLAGLEPSELQGQLLEYPVSLQLGSRFEGELLSAIEVKASSTTNPDVLSAWPLQSEFVQELLRNVDGEFDYLATLSVPMTGGSIASGSTESTNDQSRSTQLEIESDLAGASFDFPDPFRKAADQRSQFNLTLDLGESDTGVTGRLDDALGFELQLTGGELRNGLIRLGELSADAQVGIEDVDQEGLAVIGQLDRVIVEQWADYLGGLTSEGVSSSTLGDSLAYIDVDTKSLELYGQSVPEVALYIVSAPGISAWQVQLDGESASGEVMIPFAQQDYLDVDLNYLRLPGDPQDELQPAVEEERVDVLADIDPSTLPLMHFATDEFSIGEREFGSWYFTLNPVAAGADINNLAFNFRGLRLGLDEDGQRLAVPSGEGEEPPYFNWRYDGSGHRSYLSGRLYTEDLADVLMANGYEASLQSSSAGFRAQLDWPGSPVFFAAAGLSGELILDIEDGRFLQEGDGPGALKLISILNFDAIMRRLRFSDDLLRRGLAFDDIEGHLILDNGQVEIVDRLVISGPSSLYQITGTLDLAEETINGEMYLTLPVSDNIPWLGLLTANIPLAVGAYLFDRIFGDQVDSLTSAVYTLEGPWEGLQPEFKQAFGSPDEAAGSSSQ